MSNKEERLALNVINESLKLVFVKVNKDDFLVKIFGKNVEDKNILLNQGPLIN